ncbi:uncharacterized protein LOC123540547 [Mercenaria mercenaria]|uniref:uncharacterized protein LOC123540547 n=1 Tax=Mercenaria mercenaria TaxID=6596 RepID=UPI00234EE64A|nr:uncharacterized protein LOC123540547 [Mercenaria mercenaria]XP_045181583.2 uncharacterized protein LOC123540547 [Mercenaria mercenaria]
MDLRRVKNMHPLPTSQHFTNIRTDDDITAAVTNFLHNEGSNLHGKTWQDTTAEVTKWLASQIQREREGWRQKTRAAMQEIENHRKEVLKFQGLIQECLEHMKILVECCNIPEEKISHISEQEPRRALPMYLECLTETLNSLMEDRIMCLQILHADETTSKNSLPSLLKAYIEALKHHAERAHKEAKNRLESLESVNKHSFTELAKMKKAIHRKQEEVETLHAKLQEIQEVTMKKFKEVNEIQLQKDDRDFDDRASQTDLQITSGKTNERHSSPSSLYSAPTPVPAADQKNIHISAEKLSRLRRSAKKLENSLNDALSQMDTFRKGMKPTKVTQSNMFGTPRPFGLQHVPDVPPILKKEMKLLPSPMHMWSTKFEISGPKIHDAELELIKQQERDKEEKKRKAKEKRREAIQNSQERLVHSQQEVPTFRSLMKSLDDVKKTTGNKVRNYKPVGQVTKCLRCNKLFTLNDNHKKSCNYHPKGKERIEQYSDRGKLVKVTYVWKCCMMGPDNPGCTYGQHV